MPRATTKAVRYLVALGLLGGCDSVDVALISPAPASLTLLAPNGGESWGVNTTQTISWSAEGAVGQVQLELSVDGGQTFTLLADNLEGSSGSHVQLLSGSPSDDCIVRITSADGTLADDSDAPFTIAPGPLGPTVAFAQSALVADEDQGQVVVPVVIANPQGGFLLPYTVSGTASAGDHDLVDGRITIPAATATATLTFDLVNDSEEEVDETIVITLAAPIGVTLGSPAEIAVTIQANDMPELRLLSPQGGESWSVSNAEDIAWASFNSPTLVDILASRDNGTTWEVIAVNRPPSGTYSWVVTGPPSTEALIRVEANTLADTTPLPFEVSAGTLTVTSPVGGVTWTAGEMRTVQWTSDQYVGVVDILYSVDGGATFSVVARSEPNDGSLDWTVPNEDTSSAVLRVAGVLGGPVADSGPFSISTTATGPIFVDGQAMGAANGTSWSDAYLDIASALGAAVAGDELWVAEDVYAGGLVVPTGVAMYGGFVGTETSRGQRDVVNHRATIDGNGTPDVRLVELDSDTVLDGFVLTGAQLSSSFTEGGGAVLTSGTNNVAIRNAYFLDNETDGWGGAATIRSTTATLQGCRFENNRSDEGGALYIDLSTLLIEDTEFVDNEVVDSGRGGAFVIYFASSTVNRTVFSGNSATIGGAAALIGGSFSMSNGVLANNQGSFGAAMWLESATASLTNTTVVDNPSATDTPVIFSGFGGDLEVHNSVFSGNTPGDLDINSRLLVSHSLLTQVAGYIDGGGNVLGDVAFMDRAAGDYRVVSGSPTIDAADGDRAPPADALGRPRFDDPTVANGGVGVPTFVDMGAFEQVQVSSLRVLTPVPGEVWTVGATVDVTWEQAGSGPLEVLLSTDGGVTFNVVVGAVDAKAEAASVVVPDTPSDAVLVQVRSLDGSRTASSPGLSAIESTDLWHVDGTATGAEDGTSWIDAFTSVGAALAQARLGDRVHLAEGTYSASLTGTEFLALPRGVRVLGGYPHGGGQRDPVAHPVILDGGGLVEHVLTGSSGTLDGVTVTGGGNTNTEPGAGLRIEGGLFSVVNCIIENNDAGTRRGGGVAAIGTDTHLFVVDSSIRDNSGSSGSALYIESALATISNSVFERGVGANAILAEALSRLDLSESDVRDHTSGEAVQLGNTHGNRIVQVTLESNGGAVRCATSSVDIERSLLRTNSSGSGIGGIALTSNCHATITNSILDRNSGLSIGGSNTNGSLEIVSSTIYSETTTDLIFSAPVPIDVVNSILWAPSGMEIFGGTPFFVTVNYSLLNGGWFGDGIEAVNPVFVDAPNGDLRLQASSNAIDAGDGARAPSTDFNGDPRVDQPGLDKGVGSPSFVDMGALERQ